MRATGWWMLAAVGATLAACGFPEVTWEREPEPERNVPPVPEESGDEPRMEPLDRDERSPRLSTHVAPPPPNLCAGEDPCDCDGDGYRAKSATCAGNDCDDFGRFTHPNQTYITEPPTAADPGDWDCSGGVEKQYVPKLDCKTLLGLDCKGTAEGFLEDPPCGAEADFYRCTRALLDCVPQKVDRRRQACK